MPEAVHSKHVSIFMFHAIHQEQEKSKVWKETFIWSKMKIQKNIVRQMEKGLSKYIFTHQPSKDTSKSSQFGGGIFFVVVDFHVQTSWAFSFSKCFF